MKNIDFLEWQISIEDNMDAVVDIPAQKLVITEGLFELIAVIWFDEKNVLQVKPTWDCVISIDHDRKILTIRSADELRNNDQNK